MAENAHRVCQRSVYCRLHSHEGRQQNALVPRVRQTTSRSDSAMTRRRQAEEGADSPTAGGQMRDISPMASCHLSTTRLASFNTRTLTAQWKQNELMAYLEQQRIALCAIQEHRIVHKEEVRDLQLAGGWRLVTSSADAAGVVGVGFALSPKASKTLSRSIAVTTCHCPIWQSHERFRVGQGNSLTYNRMLRRDTGLELDELQKVALNRDEWRTLCHRST